MDGNAEKDLTLLVVLLAGGMLAGPCFGAEEKGAEEEKEAEKGALKPGGALVVTPARKLDTSKKQIFLRLIGPGTPDDIPLAQRNTPMIMAFSVLALLGGVVFLNPDGQSAEI